MLVVLALATPARESQHMPDAPPLVDGMSFAGSPPTGTDRDPEAEPGAVESGGKQKILSDLPSLSTSPPAPAEPRFDLGRGVGLRAWLADRPIHPEPFYRRQVTWAAAALCLLLGLLAYDLTGSRAGSGPVEHPTRSGDGPADAPARPLGSNDDGTGTAGPISFTTGLDRRPTAETPGRPAPASPSRVRRTRSAARVPAVAEPVATDGTVADPDACRLGVGDGSSDGGPVATRPADCPSTSAADSVATVGLDGEPLVETAGDGTGQPRGEADGISDPALRGGPPGRLTTDPTGDQLVRESTTTTAAEAEPPSPPRSGRTTTTTAATTSTTTVLTTAVTTAPTTPSATAPSTTIAEATTTALPTSEPVDSDEAEPVDDPESAIS